MAKFVPRLYEGDDKIQIIDVTNKNETDLFREHLYHMVDPQHTTRIIDNFITEVEATYKSN